MPDITMEAVLLAYEKHYVRAQYLWVQMMTEHLTDCSRVFRGDLQAMLILAIVGQAFLFRMLQQGNDQHNLETPIPVLNGVAITASSLAAVLEIPRETVRRKLDMLSQHGWIEKGEDGWRLALQDGRAQTRRDLTALDQRQRSRVAKLVTEFSALTHSTLRTVAGR